ncbi:hypothetical protein LTR17_027477 [Elasticomyces elasticus]|nr:hypothetical protein LTR17_027477 [Elasticomyces elasticus]
MAEISRLCDIIVVVTEHQAAEDLKITALCRSPGYDHLELAITTMRATFNQSYDVMEEDAKNLEMIREVEKVLNMIRDKSSSIKKEFTSAKEVAIKAEMKVKSFANLDQKWDSEESEGTEDSDDVGDEERSGMTSMGNPGCGGVFH